jgi:hypothetical protein
MAKEDGGAKVAAVFFAIPRRLCEHCDGREPGGNRGWRHLVIPRRHLLAVLAHAERSSRTRTTGPSRLNRTIGLPASEQALQASAPQKRWSLADPADRTIALIVTLMMYFGHSVYVGGAVAIGVTSGRERECERR